MGPLKTLRLFSTEKLCIFWVSLQTLFFSARAGARAHTHTHTHTPTITLSLSQFPRAHLHVVGMLQFMSDINQPGLPTPFCSVLVSVSVFMTLSAVFHSINSPDNSPLSHSVLPVSFLPYWPFLTVYLFTKISLSPDIILCGWLGLKPQLTNSLRPRLCTP